MCCLTQLSLAGALLALSLVANAQPKYRNLFAEYGYAQADIDAKVDAVVEDLFHGPKKIYFPFNDTEGTALAYITDVKNHDVRTEGMSYGMMIAVQFGDQDMFDRIWRWSVKYMQHRDGSASDGYFAWSCRTDGHRNSQGSASDGEFYFVTALLLASNRWGNSGDVNYLKEAQYILNSAFSKTGAGGVTNFINDKQQEITFTPDTGGSQFTDPSYHVPVFYEVWAKYAEDGRADKYLQYAKKSRTYLHSAAHQKTGLTPDQTDFQGKPHGGGALFGQCFRFDAWRVPMNVALDYTWSGGADAQWQQQYGERLQSFLYAQGVHTFVDQWNIDGTKPAQIAPAGGKTALRHSLGFVGTAAAVSLVCQHNISREFVDELWNAKHEPYSDGYYDAYYDGLLQLFAFMHLSGRYRMIEPSHPAWV